MKFYPIWIILGLTFLCACNTNGYSANENTIASNPEKTTTTNAKFISAEFIGHCRVVFKADNGEELVFINPDLGSVKSDEGCGVNWDLHDTDFLLTYTQGEVTFYTEDVGDQKIQGNILISIKQQ